MISDKTTKPPDGFRVFVFSRFRPREALVLALVFLAFHLPYLPQSLEDVDSINFALGVQRFDVAGHQPHPPGYPLFVLAAKGAHLVMPSEAKALSAVSIVAAALGALAIAALFRRLDQSWSPAWLIAATALAIACPLYWFTAARPLSDLTGLAAAIAIQALILSATTERALVTAAFLAAFAAGIRSQVVWLTVPLLVLAAAPEAWKRQGRDRWPKRSALHRIALAYVGGIVVWAVPLIVLTGGPAAYWRALFSQGAEDLTGIRMLWTTPNIRTLVEALYYALIAPWAVWPVAAIVLLLATAGAGALLLRNGKALLALAVAFGPYFVFDVVFQEAFTSRYALPLVVPLAYLAAAGARLLPRDAGLVVAAVLGIYCAHVGGTSVAAYASRKAPAFRLLDDMHSASAPAAPVLAMDRREEFDLRRPTKWIGDAMPPFAQKLPSPPQHEWLELVKYWNSGGRAPVWFVADPRRADIHLVEHRRGNRGPAEYRWSIPYPVLLSGVRPNEMDWYRIARPEWYLGEGWALTPESAGVSDRDHRGLSAGAIEGWIARETLDGSVVVGGRNFETSPRSVVVTLGDAPLDQWSVPPGFFVRFVKLRAVGDAPADYVKLAIRTSPPSRVAIEQFDVSASRPLLGFGDGWHEPEYNPQNGLRWRWLSEKGELKVRSPMPSVRLHLEGESPRRYFSRDSRLLVRAGDAVVLSQTLSADFSLDIPISHVTDTITVETDQFFMPVERGWFRRSGDRRHLGLRIFKCELR